MASQPTLRLLTLFFLLSVLLLSCSDDGQDETIVIKLGVVQSITGTGAVYAPSTLHGVELAIKEIEATTRYRFESTIADDQSNIDRGVAVYRELVDSGVNAIIGPTLSNVGSRSLRVAQEARIPAISPITTASGIGAIGDYVFRIALAEDASLPALVEFVARRERIRDAVMVHDSRDAYSRSAAEAMRKGLASAGGSVTAEVDLAWGLSMSELLVRSEVEQAQAILIPLILEPAVQVLGALRDAGVQKPIIGGEAIATTDMVRLAGPAVDGVYVATTWHPDLPNEASRRFVQAYQQTYGQAPEHFAASSYTAVYVLIDAIRRAGSTDAGQVRDALAATQNLATILGTLSMSPQGDAVFTPVFQQFQNGQLVMVR